MQKAFILAMALLALVACSQNNKEPGGGKNAPVVAAPEPEVAPAAPTPKAATIIADDVLALYSGVVIELTSKASNEVYRVEIPFAQATQVEGTPVIIEVTQFLPDFVMSDSGYETRSLEPINAAARVHITGTSPEFDGVLFMQYPDVHPYAGEEYAIILTDVIKR